MLKFHPQGQQRPSSRSGAHANVSSNVQGRFPQSGRNRDVQSCRATPAECRTAIAAAACAMLLQLQPANAEGITYRYKASQDPLVRQAQAELVQTYGAHERCHTSGFTETSLSGRHTAYTAWVRPRQTQALLLVTLRRVCKSKQSVGAPRQRTPRSTVAASQSVPT